MGVFLDLSPLYSLRQDLSEPGAHQSTKLADLRAWDLLSLPRSVEIRHLPSAEVGHPNSGLHAYVAGTLPTEPCLKTLSGIY